MRSAAPTSTGFAPPAGGSAGAPGLNGGELTGAPGLPPGAPTGGSAGGLPGSAGFAPPGTPGLIGAPPGKPGFAPPMPGSGGIPYGGPRKLDHRIGCYRVVPLEGPRDGQAEPHAHVRIQG
ncbi:MAG: hypothetical protein FJ304_24905, partial [Planctomycetes bacterium]|nr:hypothetical protein [Planctomycetota bacterium]